MLCATGICTVLKCVLIIVAAAAFVIYLYPSHVSNIVKSSISAASLSGTPRLSSEELVTSIPPTINNLMIESVYFDERSYRKGH